MEKDIEEIIKKTLRARNREPFDSDKVDEQIKQISGCAAALIDIEDFQQGDIVFWKDGLKNRKFPLYGQPGVVVEYFSDEKIVSDEGGGSQYFRELLNIRIGFIHEDGDFVTFYFDPHRFTKNSPNAK